MVQVDKSKEDLLEEIKILQHLSEQQQAILDASPAMIFYKDKENRFIRVNDAIARANGMSKKEMEGKTGWDIYPQEAANRYWQDDKEVMISGKPKLNIIEEMMTPSGIMWVSTDKIPYRDPKGEIIGIIGFTLDITAQKKMDEEMKRVHSLQINTLNAIDDIFYAFDKNGKFLLWNETFRKVTGYSDAELSLMRPTDFFAQEDHRRIAAVIEKIWQEGSGQVTVNLVLKDKTQVPYEFNGTALKDSAGNIIGLSGTGRNLVEHRKMVEQLKRSELWFKTLFNGASEGILVVDIQTKKFSYANPAMCRMFGYTQEEFSKLGIVDIHPKEYLDHVVAEFEAQVREDRIVVVDIPCLSKDRKMFYAQIKTAVLTLDGRACTVGFFTDITERKKLEKELQEKVANLEKLNNSMIGRELRVIDIKKEVNKLCRELGKPEPYGVG
ncbi:MAG: PAS domain S-box protein [Candidatus Omnitrophica bacterium]|nr:PAS domain S-box protein [Candidatus Omnitrophota bacterium]